ncbi:MAG: Flp pilus assembly complex ATPase component TadA [Desulfosarcina sp.]|nr:Flp pilus assembly complex ATPase component TadA [Desulfobacterales bacterium]
MITTKKLGEMLLEGGLLNEEQLKQAVAGHKRNNMKLGQFLVRGGIVSSTQIMDLVSTQLNIRKYNPEDFPIDMALASILPVEMAHKYQAVPLCSSNFLLTVVMTDPMDIAAMDAVEAYTNTEIEPVICTDLELTHLVNVMYGTYSGIDGVLDTMDKIEFKSDKSQAGSVYGDDIEVGSLQDMAEEAPVVRLVNSVLSQAVREGASDIHISPEKNYVQVRFRVDGKLHEVPAPPKSMILPVISRLKILANMDIAIARIPQDGRFTVKMDKKEINFRASTMPTIYGENIVLRLLDTSTAIHTLNSLGMSAGDREKIESMIIKPHGMILSTGPTGSGKSTTLYSIIKKINTPEINIITLEDPVEYRLEKIRQIQLNRRAGMTFASGLRSVIRQDPDVIMIGEIRDVETAGIAVQAALTGHRVLSTVHTNDAAGAITRLLDMGIESFLASSVILASIAQRLIRKVCPYCKESWKPSAEALKYWGLDKIKGADFVRGAGCMNCMNKGYSGRTGIFEVLIIDDMVRTMILKNKTAHEITTKARETGQLTTLKDDAVMKVVQGITTLEEAASAVMM